MPKTRWRKSRKRSTDSELQRRLHCGVFPLHARMPHQQPVLEVQTPDGHRFELIHVPCSAPRARLLFLPGMGVSARQYIAFGQALAVHGIESWIHEWRGLGSSNWRADRAADWGYRELLQQDLLGAVDRIQAVIRGQPIILGGHSLGSQLACLLGALRPEACAGLLIVAGGAPYWRAFSGWMRFGLPTIFFTMPAIAGLVGHYPGRRLGFAGREARGVIRDWTLSGRRGVYTPSGIDHDLEQGMRDLNVPALSLRMADDWFVPQSSLDWLKGKLGSAHHEQTVLTGEHLTGAADHYRWMREPDSSALAIADWLNRQPASELARAAASNRA